jgi:hypothetical protein
MNVRLCRGAGCHYLKVTVILVPVNDVEDVVINWWNWRPTVALLLRAGAISVEQAERLHAAMGATTVSGAEAIKMADVVEQLLATLPTSENRVLLDGTVTNSPPKSRGIPVEWDWYGAGKPWLERFAAFCRRSGGFTPN